MILKYLKINTVIALLVAGLTSCSDKTDNTHGEEESQVAKLDIQVLEREDKGNGAVNLAIFTATPDLLNAETAAQAAEEECGKNCNMVYFYTDKEAYTLHFNYSRLSLGNFFPRIATSSVASQSIGRIQFTSQGFVKPLLEKGIRISMDGKGRALDNVFIERFWRSLKQEYVYLNPPNGGMDLYRGAKAYVGILQSST